MKRTSREHNLKVENAALRRQRDALAKVCKRVVDELKDLRDDTPEHEDELEDFPWMDLRDTLLKLARAALAAAKEQTND
ncbi:MAG: hypothetical protein IMZ62_12985 [Chloroflexi bacterium]|nr:hypothetical protein [Chloroflexota bacterium]MBE3118193.1 hypothetical protein [Candidatus Atribacteria bacterium]